MSWGSGRLQQRAARLDGVAGCDSRVRHESNADGWREMLVQARTKRQLAELCLGSVICWGGSCRLQQRAEKLDEVVMHLRKWARRSGEFGQVVSAWVTDCSAR